MVGERSSSKDCYKQELDNVNKLKSAFDSSKLSPKQQPMDEKLVSPKERLKDLEEIKKNRRVYRDFKEAHALAGRRDRLVKCNWKNGIAGVDSVMDKNTYFFKDQQDLMMKSELDKLDINERNKEGTSSI